MAVYVFAFVSSTALLYFGSKKYSNFVWPAVFLILFIIPAIRWYVGTDFRNYHLQFITETYRYWEKGYVLLCDIALALSEDSVGIFALTSFVTTFFFIAAIRSKSVNPAFSIALYMVMLYYFTFFNLVRQGIAVSLTTYSLVYAERKKTYSVILMMIAVMFHYSAIIVLLLSPFILSQHTRTGYWVSFLFIPVICLVSYWLSREFIVNSPYARYMDEIVYRLNWPQILKEFVLCVLCIRFFDRIRSKTPIAGYLINLQFINLFLYCLIGIPYINRITVYFKISQILLFPALFACIRGKEIRSFCSFAFILVWFALCFYYIGIRGYIGVVPYRTVFSR
ncbi:MAG: EpsG family protein [Prevotellaceae bacterium]|jgi:hypothetical protein|nr:EpsG family protein [Prevotellaceae bacterium]